LRDGINIEQRDVPAAVICTRPFIPTAKAMAKICNLPDYPFAVVGHPIGSLTPKELAERAALALPQVIAILEGTAGVGPQAK
jgi:hypothetical protein